MKTTTKKFSTAFAWGYTPDWDGTLVLRLSYDPLNDPVSSAGLELSRLRPFSVLASNLECLLDTGLKDCRGKSLVELDGALMISREGRIVAASRVYHVDEQAIAFAHGLEGATLAEQFGFKAELPNIGTGTVRSRAVSYLLPPEVVVGRFRSSGTLYLFQAGKIVLCTAPGERVESAQGPLAPSIERLARVYSEIRDDLIYLRAETEGS